jgi:hypothetical protein
MENQSGFILSQDAANDRHACREGSGDDIAIDVAKRDLDVV